MSVEELEFVLSVITATLVIIFAIAAGVVVARKVYKNYSQRAGRQRGREEAQSVADRINRLKLEVDVYLHDKGPPSIEPRKRKSDKDDEESSE